MTLLAETDFFAVKPHYYIADSLLHGQTIAALVDSEQNFRLDRLGVNLYLNKMPDTIRTCFHGICKLPPNCRLFMADGKLSIEQQPFTVNRNAKLYELLIRALLKYTANYNRCALALSGGLDSALILSLIKEACLYNIEVYTLATGIAGYCELETTKRTAKYFGVKLNIVQATANDFVATLVDFIASSETPIFNLHPVSKLILAHAMIDDGANCIITGDAADQAFCGIAASNYLPIIGAVMRDAGIAYVSPFFDRHVAAYGLLVADKNKSALRTLAATLLPNFLCVQKKQARYAPEFDISRYWNKNSIQWISEYLDLVPELKVYSVKTLWTTLGMLVQNMNGKITCAE